jgi:outer membrane protein assembly factor BamB
LVEQEKNEVESASDLLIDPFFSSKLRPSPLYAEPVEREKSFDRIRRRGKQGICMKYPWSLMCVLACLTTFSALAGQSGSNACATLLDSWPQWRGPLANGVAPHANPPVQWSETNNVRWKIPLPGKAHSSPIVFGDSIYLLSALPVGDAQKPVYDDAPGVHDSVPVTHRHQFVALAVSRRDGRVLWLKVLREEWPHEGGHVTGSLASSTPATDGERLYAFFGSRGLYCLDLNGEVTWQKDLGRMHTLHAHGEGSSPVLHGNTLIVCWDHEAGSWLYAFEKHTGKIIWKVARDEKTSWSTPLIIEEESKSQVIVSATKRVRGYDLATGTQLWECAGLTDNVVSSPVYYRGLVISGNSYYSQAMVAIRLAGAKGDVTGTDHVVWKLNRLTPYVSSPLLYDDTLYVLRHNQNVLSRFDPLTGKPRGETLRLEGINDFIFSSPVGAAGRIYVTGRDGSTVVLRHDRENATLAVNHLEDSFSASPAVVDREFYLRGERFLYCIAER